MIIDVAVEADLSGLQALEISAAEFERRWKEEVLRQLLFVQGAWLAAVSGHVYSGMTKSVQSDRYAEAISDAASLEYPFNGDEFSGRVIATDSRIVARIERGYGSFDMKPGALTGPASQVGRHGQRYTTVPISHSVPGSTGQKGSPMPAEIYNQVQRLQPGQRLGGAGGYGRRSKLPAGVNAEAIRRGRSGPMMDPYTWKLSPYAGLGRIGRYQQQGFVTYRRISGQWIDSKGERHGSSAASWIHPGQPPNPVVESVQRYVEPLIREAFEALVREAGTSEGGLTSGA